MTHCEAKARANLNVQQFEAMAAEDARRASWSAKRLERCRRQKAIHDAACLTCGGVA